MAAMTRRTRRQLRRPTWPFALNRNTSRANGLVGWWPMVSGSIVRNLAVGGGSTYAFASGGFIEFPPLAFGGVACNGDNTTADIAINNGSIANATKPTLPATIAVWVIPHRADPSPGQTIFATDAMWLTSTNYNGLDIITDGAGHFEADYGDGAGASSSNRRSTGGSVSWVVSQPYRVVASFTQGAAPTLYVNGVKDAGTPSGTSSLQVGYSTAAGAFGGPSAGNTSEIDFFLGLVWDCCIWNRALTAPEVAADYAPATRWDLYAKPTRRIRVSSAGGVTVKWPGFYADEMSGGFDSMGMAC